MALITAVGLFVVSLLTAVLSRIVAEEIEAWSPSIIRRLIKLAIAWLPNNQRERFEEEWQSHVNEVPGRVGKLLSAVGFLLAAHKMALTFRRKQVVDSWLQSIARLEHSNAKLATAMNEIQGDKTLATRQGVSSALGALSSTLSKSKQWCSNLSVLVAQLSDLPTIPTTLTTLIAKLRIGYMSRIALRRFYEMSSQAEDIDERCDNLTKVISEWKRVRTQSASPTKPILNEAAEK